MCTIVEGMIAVVHDVVRVIKGGSRHSSQCTSGENGEESLSLESHASSMNSPDKSCEQSTKGRHGHPVFRFQSAQETFKDYSDSE